jgi:hypothetical protein
MDFLKRFFKDEVMFLNYLLFYFFKIELHTIDWAISNLNTTFDEFDVKFKYPDYDRKQKITKKSISIIKNNLNIALPKIFNIFDSLNPEDKYSYPICRANNMLYYLSFLNEPDWLQYMIKFAGSKNMTNSSFSAVVKSGSEHGFKAICEKLSNIKVPNDIMFLILQEFMNFLFGEIIIMKYQKNWVNVPEAICLLKQASNSEDNEVSERALEILHKANIPISFSDDEIKTLIDIIANDPCELATPSHVKICEEAMIKLGYMINENQVKLLFPLFNHHYWRVRKHAVMVGKNAIEKMNPSSGQKILLELLKKASQDENETVRAVSRH